VSEWFDNNYEIILAVVIYAVERLQARYSKRRKNRLDAEVSKSGKTVTKKRRALNLLFDVLPIVSRLRSKKG